MQIRLSEVLKPLFICSKSLFVWPTTMMGCWIFPKIFHYFLTVYSRHQYIMGRLLHHLCCVYKLHLHCAEGIFGWKTIFGLRCKM